MTVGQEITLKKCQWKNQAMWTTRQNVFMAQKYHAETTAHKNAETVL
jgi:hypothetical protein